MTKKDRIESEGADCWARINMFIAFKDGLDNWGKKEGEK